MYAIEIEVVKDGNLRSYKQGQFRIVETTDESDLKSPADFGVEIKQLDAAVFLGGAEEGASDYSKLSNKPKIGGVTLQGDKTLHELGIQPKGDYVEKGYVDGKSIIFPYDLKYITDSTSTETVLSIFGVNTISDLYDLVCKIEKCDTVMLRTKGNYPTIVVVNKLQSSIDHGSKTASFVLFFLEDKHSYQLSFIVDVEGGLATGQVIINELAIHSDIPLKTSQLNNDSDFVTKSYVNDLIGQIGNILDEINGEVI